MYYSVPTMNPILIAAAVIPAAILLVKIYKADRLEKEPSRLLLNLVIMGVISTSLAMFSERIGMAIGAAVFQEDSLAYRVFLYYLVVGLSEEGFKYLLLKRRTWKEANFNCQFDAVVYATFVSLGFALWENISYVASYGIATALVRAVTAVPGHACFGVFMGVCYGAAKKYANAGQEAESRKSLTMAVVVPVLLHGTYDFVASAAGSGAAVIFFGFVAVLFVLAWRLVRKTSRTDKYIDGKEHYDDLWKF